MSVLKKIFNYGLSQFSPLAKDFNRIVNYDEDGNEIITYEEVDYSKLQRSLGSVSDWSLSNLLKAGINPNFPIHTTPTTRLENLSTVADWSAAADSILNEKENNNNN